MRWINRFRLYGRSWNNVILRRGVRRRTGGSAARDAVARVDLITRRRKVVFLRMPQGDTEFAQAPVQRRPTNAQRFRDGSGVPSVGLARSEQPSSLVEVSGNLRRRDRTQLDRFHHGAHRNGAICFEVPSPLTGEAQPAPL